MKKIALITGGTKGIGFATAVEFGKAGYKVCICSRDAENLAAAKQKLSKLGIEAEIFQCDISVESKVSAMFRDIGDNIGLISVLVNNASITTYKNTIEEITLKNYSAVFDVNVLGAMMCVKEASKHMKELGEGAIINISSEAAKFGGNEMSLYAASKGAIDSFTKASSKELGKYNIRVNAVSPAIIDSGIHKLDDNKYELLANSIPLKRLGKVEEVSSVIKWLASDESSYITGSILSVSGGR